MRKAAAMVLAGLALTLQACATVPRLRAADDVHAFLVAVRDGDRARFEAHLDRPALKSQLKSRLIAEAAKAHGPGSLASLGVVLTGALVDLGVDTLVTPEVFRAEAIRLGYDPEQPLPGALALAALVRPLGDGRACVSEKRGGPCVFAFNEEAGVWKLAGYEGPLDRLTAAPRPRPGAAPKRPAAPR